MAKCKVYYTYCKRNLASYPICQGRLTEVEFSYRKDLMKQLMTIYGGIYYG